MHEQQRDIPPTITETLKYFLSSRERSRQDQVGFGQMQSEVDAKFADTLPPPSPELQFVTVAAAYNEFRNNNFWNLLQSYYHQKKRDGFSHELIIVVNNSRDQAEQESPEFLDNQSTLKILSILNRLTILTRNKAISDEEIRRMIKEMLGKLEISEWEIQLLIDLIKNQADVYGIDLSSKGNTPDEIFEHKPADNKLGVALNVGTHVAFNRLSRSQKPIDQTYIDFLAADCSFTLEYFDKLHENVARQNYPTYLSKPTRTGFYEVAESISSETDCLKMIARLIAQIKQTTRRHFMYLSQNDANTGEKQCVRTDILKAVGGYPYIYKSDEDYRFAELIAVQTGQFPYALSAPELKRSHRSRIDSTDGKNAGYLFQFENKPAYLAMRQLARLNNFDLILKLLETNAMIEGWLSPEQMDKYRFERSRRFKKERLLRILFQDHCRKIISALTNEPRHSNEPIDQYLFRLQARNLLSNQLYDFFLHNPSLILAIEFLVSVAKSKEKKYKSIFGNNINRSDIDSIEEKIWIFLQQYIPEYFNKPLEQEPDYSRTLTVLQNGDKDVNEGDFIHLATAIYPWLV